MEQRSEEWLRARAGCITASRISDVMAKGKGGAIAASRINYEAQLIAERLTGEAQESFESAAMRWGTDTEPQARAAYAFLHDAEVEEVGFIRHPGIAAAGASPDGLVGADGLVEIKCPNTATHIAYLLGEETPRKYLLQMQFQMACTGRAWCDFASFDPRMPDDMQLLVRRVERDAALIAEIEAEVRDFQAGVSQKLAKLLALRGDDFAMAG